MNAPQSIELDDTDERIIELLRSDGRMAYRAMAAELGLTEATVRSRVRRLEESNAMRVVAVTDFQAAGYELMLAVGLKVENRTPLEVAEDLALLPEVFSINLVIGAYDIEILVVAEDQSALAELIYQRLAAVPGVQRVAPSLALDVLKNQPDWVPLSTQTANGPASSEGRGATSLSGVLNNSTHRPPSPYPEGITPPATVPNNTTNDPVLSSDGCAASPQAAMRDTIQSEGSCDEEAFSAGPGNNPALQPSFADASHDNTTLDIRSGESGLAQLSTGFVLR